MRSIFHFIKFLIAILNWKKLGLGLAVFLIMPALYGQDTISIAIAEKGDGIFSLLRKQGINPADHYQDFISLNKDNLREGQHLYEGSTYLVPLVESNKVNEAPPEVEKGESYPIFGEKEKFVVRKSDRLSGAIYYLISGHGGPDPGAIETYQDVTIAEDEYAYDVTLRLAKELLSHGANVYLIVRDENDGIRDARTLEIDRDEVVYPQQEIPLNQLDRLRQRVDAVNDLYLSNIGAYQRLIVTHVDSRSRGQNIDVFFYHHKKSKNGKRLAEHIHQTFIKKYKTYQPNRDYTGSFSDRSNLYLVKNTLPAMAYIEIGNLRNKKDQRRILDPDNRQAMAKWISEGVLADFESK